MRRGMQGRFSGLDALRRRLANSASRRKRRWTSRVRSRRSGSSSRRSWTASGARCRSRPRTMRGCARCSWTRCRPTRRERSGSSRDYRFMDPEAQRLFDELHGAPPRTGAGRALPEHGRRLEEHDAPKRSRASATCSPSSTRLIEQRARGRGARLRGVHGALRRPLPERSAEPGRAPGGHGPPHGGDEPAHGVAQRRATGRAHGARRTGDAGHGPGVRGQPARVEPGGRVPGHAVGRAHDGRPRRRRAPCRCRPPSTPWSACTTTRTWTARSQGDYPGATVDDVDEEALRRMLGEPAVHDLRRLKQVERALEEAGLVNRRNGRLEVTPRGARKLGERALAQVFEELKRDREGTHEARDAGGMAEPTGADPAVAVRRHRPDRGAAHGVQRRGPRPSPGEPIRLRRPTTSSWSRPSSAPRPRRRSCWTSRSRCRCAGTSSTRRRWRWRCTR